MTLSPGGHGLRAAEPRTRYRILVIDDHEPTRALLADALGQDGYVVATEATALGGLARATVELFDLVISEVGLPDMGGAEFVLALRRRGITAPVLALSGQLDEAERERALDAGFDDYLFKPIKETALRSYVGGRLRRVDRSGRAAPSGVSGEGAAASGTPEVTVLTAAPRRRGVLGGLVVVAMGIPFVLQPLGVPNAASYLFIAMGGAFLIAYLRGQHVYLIPMVTLLSFGIALLLPTWFVLRPETVGPTFVGIVAIGFLVAFALAPARRWPLVPAGFLGAVSAMRLVAGISFIPSHVEPFLVPVVLIGVGLYLLIEQPA